MKLQFWSFDVVFAMILFGVAIMLLIFVWFNTSTQFSLAYGNGIGSMQTQIQSLQVRITSQGAPIYWNSLINTTNSLTWSNISIGLGNGNGALSSSKLLTFAAMSSYDYQSTKARLGVGYDYYIIIKGPSLYVALGQNPNINNATAVQVITVPVVVDTTPAQMQIFVWTNTTFGIG